MASRIIKNSLLSAISGGATLLGNLASTILVARLLGVAATGAVAYATWLAIMGVALLDFGAQSTLARFLPELRQVSVEKADAFAAALFRPYLFVAAFVIASACAAAIVFANPVLTDVGNLAGFAAIGGLCMLQALANFGLGELRGRQDFRAAALTTLLSLALQIAFVVIGALVLGPFGVILGYCCGSAPMALRALRLLNRRASAVALDRRHLRFAAFTWAGGLASAFVWSRSEVFFLQRYWGPEAVALLTVGLTFSNLAAQGPLLLTGALLPFFSEKAAVDREALNRAFASGTRILAFLALPLCFGAAGVMPGLIDASFGPRFLDASLPGAIIVLATALAAPGAVGTHVMYARDRSDFIFYVTAAGALLSVASGFLIVPRWGLMGAVCARATIQILLVVSGFWFLGARLKCPVPLNHLLRLVLSAAICALAARLVLIAFPIRLSLAPAILVGAIAYFLAVRLLRALPDEDLERLGDMQQRLPSALRWAPKSLVNFLSHGAASALPAKRPA